ncbi:MAG: sensory transduction histidine kinase [Ramlibacter sp.]|nr:sensory transduction histidine kinase [Ramlibacter sp.]
MNADVMHACAFFDSAEAEYRALVPFVRECLHAGGRCVHFFDRADKTRRLQRLAQVAELGQAAADGQFELLDWEETYLRGGRFDADATLALVGELFGDRHGFPWTWGWGDMEWAQTGQPGSEQIIEYESRLNTVLQPGADRVVCAYDVRRHDATMVMDILCAHPMVMTAGSLRPNPLFVPPQRFLPAYRERRARQGRRAPHGGAA